MQTRALHCQTRGLILNSRDSQQEQRGRSSHGKEDENFLLHIFLALTTTTKVPLD